MAEAKCIRWPVETLGHKTMVSAAEPLCPAFGHLDTAQAGQLGRNHLPCPGIFRISGARKLDDPQVSVFILHIGFRPGPAQ